MATGIKTISCKLVAAPYQEQHIEATMQAFADACNYIAGVGRENEESAKYKLQKLCYHDVRERFGLSANLTIRALGRVAPRLKKKETRHSTFEASSVDYDQRIFSFRESDWTVSLTLLTSRERFSLDIGDWQRQELAGREPTSAVLSKKRGSKGSPSYFIDIQIKTGTRSYSSGRGADFKCESCGHVADADVNAACNIAAHGGLVSGLVESETMSCRLHQGSRPDAKA